METKKYVYMSTVGGKALGTSERVQVRVSHRGFSFVKRLSLVVSSRNGQKRESYLSSQIIVSLVLSWDCSKYHGRKSVTRGFS